MFKNSLRGADFMSAIRLSSFAKERGIVDPYAHLFLADQNDFGDSFHQIAPALSVLILNRWTIFNKAIDRAAKLYKQIVFLGVGFDTRSLWLEFLKAGNTKIFEVDFELVLNQKKTVFSTHDIKIPAYLKFVSADINREEIFYSLKNAGFDANQPSAFFLEGLVYFLDFSTNHKIFNSNYLQLIPGSFFMADCWSDLYVDSRNRSGKSNNYSYSSLPVTEDGTIKQINKIGCEDISVFDLINSTRAPSSLGQPSNLIWPIISYKKK